MESVSGNIFSERNLKVMNDIEMRVQTLSGYNDICLTLFNGQCDKPWSVLRLFDASYVEADSSFNASSYQNGSEIICKGFQNSATSNFVKLFLETNYNPCIPSSLATTTRIFFHFGLSSAENLKSKRTYFQTNYLKPLVNHIANIELLNRINIYYYSLELFIHDASSQAVADLWWGAGSFTFIFLIMWLQTASLWITFMGLYSIITSFLLTNFIYRYCFGYIYFGFFHIAAMFIIIGIGADDVFVFYDTWRLTGNKNFPSKAHRLSEFYKIAAKTTFITSLTTTLAFLATSFSPLLAVKTFGLFSAILVAVNYMFDLLYFPTAVMLYSEIIKPFADDKLLKCYCLIKTIHFRIRGGHVDQTKIAQRESMTNKNFEDRNKVVLFFKNKFYRLMTTRTCKISVPLFFSALSVFFIYWATQLETSTGSVSNKIIYIHYDTWADQNASFFKVS
ncbi:hypothetical protein FSP39_021384 [Pinctada imbricata]|uniref:SSD domain-containing protein n=1 Tax=Pinctada imbricata TaxID=66713 RepID=A0AA89BTH4_PINIB|nr:hypothetical protein FSP39_021384 [Pinctada imbricata]